MRTSIAVSMLFALTCLTPGGARAGEAESPLDFGESGQWVATLQTFGQVGGFAFVHRNNHSDWQTEVHPAIDYFVVDHFSIGAGVGFGYDSVGTGNTLLEVGGRLGYDVNIGSSVSFWPTTGIFYYHLTGNGMRTQANINLEVLAPVLYHPAPHVFAGLGPSLNLLLNESQDHQYGIDFVLGGWF